MENAKLVCIPMVTGCKLSKDVESPKTDERKYKLMIGGLLYLAPTRHDIMQDVCLVFKF